MKDDIPYLKHIRGALTRIEEFTAGMEHKDFVADVKTQDAVVREFTVVGEAAKRLSTGLRQKHPVVPWRRLAGVRDVLIHKYFEVDLEEVWNLMGEISRLRRAIEGILAELESTPTARRRTSKR